MRVFVVVVYAAALLAMPASAADVDPKALVLRPADVPAGFRLNPEQTGVYSNKTINEGGPADRRAVARSGRISGYVRYWMKRGGDTPSVISSRTDLCRQPQGAQVWLTELDESMQKLNDKSGLSAYVRERVRLGDEGWAYWGTYPPTVTLYWRHGRAVALLDTWGLTLRQALELARVQQRRIAAGLR